MAKNGRFDSIGSGELRLVQYRDQERGSTALDQVTDFQRGGRQTWSKSGGWLRIGTVCQRK